MAIDDDKDGGGVNVQSGDAMGFGGGFDLGSVGTGGAFDAAGGGFGGGLGLTEARDADLGAQVSMGEGNAWGPSFGHFSRGGAAVGTVLGALAGMPGAGLLGAYGPGAINSMFGRGGTPEMPGIFGSGPNAAANSIGAAGAGGSGGLLGLGDGLGQQEALAQLYLALRAAGRVA